MKTRRNIQKELIAPTLDDLLNDGRLARLFSEGYDCALQLWVLQIKHEQETENRVIYGRLLPYSFSNASWSATDDDEFNQIGLFQTQVVKLNLYAKSDACLGILQQLSSGRNLSAISESLGLKLPKKLKNRFGSTVLQSPNLLYKPVTYLLNRDAYEQHSLSSPHASAGALSASLVQEDKQALLSLGGDYKAELAELVVKRLNADTGLEFASSDTVRLGDVELLVFPTLDDKEQSLLTVNRETAPCCGLTARFDSRQVPYFDGFSFRLSILNSAQILYSVIAITERNEEGLFECYFELSDQMYAMTDSTELEIFGFHNNQPQKSTLCCRYKVYYLRELFLQMNPIGRFTPVKFDWLEKTTRPSASARVKSALSLNRDSPSRPNRIGGREADSWVSANRSLSSLFERIHPSKSEGAFFLRHSQSNGEGRLQFVEWLKKLLGKYQQHQVVIFDPYFEDVGLGLVMLNASQQANYIVFTSLLKKKEVSQNEVVNPTQSRVNNLIANCEHNRALLQHINFRIYGLKDGRLHDRYILIMGQDNLPIAGFHLSNSFQKAAENYPLLVTPIPADVLLKVEQYTSELIREAQDQQSEEDTENSPMRLLFDSKTTSTKAQRYEPLTFLENTLSGGVLSNWTDEHSLRGLHGDQLKKQMNTKNLLKDSSLAFVNKTGLLKCLEQQMGQFEGFAGTWGVIGEVLAHSPAGDEYLSELEGKHDFMKFLEQFLNESFSRRMHDEETTEWSVVDSQCFQDPVETFLYSSQHPEHFAQFTKYKALTWAEYYTIKYLWRYAPDALVKIAENQSSFLSEEDQIQDIMRLSLLSQIISQIALGIQFKISERQREILVRSSNGLLQWIGLNAIEQQLEKTDGLSTVFKLIDTFPHHQQVRNLGWMVHRATRDKNKTETYQNLVEKLLAILPAAIDQIELESLIDSMRGHMKQLAWAEPWLFQDVIWPLIQSGRVNNNNACKIWIQELVEMLEPKFKKNPIIFDLAREGNTTNITAFLFAYSSSEQQEASLQLIQPVLRRQQQIIQQPLASTSNWSRWSNALVVSMWILAFTRWIQYYLHQRGITESNQLEELSQTAHNLSISRSMDEWESSTGQKKSLIDFLNQAEELLQTESQSV